MRTTPTTEDRVPGPAPESPAAPNRHRSRRTVTVVAVLLLAVGAFLAVRLTSHESLSAPRFGAGDALPATLKAGEHYTARLSVALDDDWTSVAATDHRRDVVVVARVTSARSPDGAILCSGTVVPGSRTRLSCPLGPLQAQPSAVTITLGVGDAFGVGEDRGVLVTHEYKHEVG